MAGARVPVEGRSHRGRASLRRSIVQEILEAFGQDPRRFTRIITLREALHDASSSTILPSAQQRSAQQRSKSRSQRSSRDDGGEPAQKTTPTKKSKAVNGETSSTRTTTGKPAGSRSSSQTKHGQQRLALATKQAKHRHTKHTQTKHTPQKPKRATPSTDKPQKDKETNHAPRPRNTREAVRTAAVASGK